MESPSPYHDPTRPSCAAAPAPLLSLLPSCIILLAIDIAMRGAQRPKALTSGPSDGPDPSLILADRLRGVTAKAQKVVADFKEYERRLQLIRRNPPSPPPPRNSLGLSLKLGDCAALTRSYSDSTLDQVRSSEVPRSRTKKQKSVSPAFEMLCERLLQQKEIQKQKKEIKSLERSLASSKKARDAAAFKTLCDSLLQSHQHKQKDKEIKELKEDREREKRSRVGVVTRAAAQMVLDVQKDRMVEEFVKDVLKEAEESRQAVVNLKGEHEKEIQDMVSLWRKEQRQMKREIEQLRAAQEAKALEQEISNELEDRLFESLEHEREAQYIDFDDADTYLEEMSVMSSSSTCVDSPSPSPGKQAHFRSCCVSNPGSPLPRPKVDPSQFAGFSFNPLFFGNTGRSSPSLLSKRASMGDLLELSTPPRSRRNSTVTRPTPLRSTWRV